MQNKIKYLVFCLIVCLGHGSAFAGGKDTPDKPKKTECQYVKNKTDGTSGSPVRILEQELLLNYQGSYMKGSETVVDDPVAVYAHVANYNNSFLLYLRIEVLSTKAQSEYGSIYTGDKLLLKLKNDEVITLVSGKSEPGNADNVLTSYSVFFPIGNDALKKLKSQEVVKVRVQWSKGYMDYDINNKDFFIRQIACAE